jgi:hypothetical protein
MIRQHAASVFLGSLLAAGFAAGLVNARGSSGGENPWSAEHVGGLPADIRGAVDARARACGNAPAARHYFSTSITVGGRLFRSLHFEDFACGNRVAVCTADGCLHEIYLESSGRYRRVFSTYAGDMKMGSEAGVLVVEVTGGRSSGRYRWEGNRFVPVGRNPE